MLNFSLCPLHPPASQDVMVTILFFFIFGGWGNYLPCCDLINHWDSCLCCCTITKYGDLQVCTSKESNSTAILKRGSCQCKILNNCISCHLCVFYHLDIDPFSPFELIHRAKCKFYWSRMQRFIWAGHNWDECEPCWPVSTFIFTTLYFQSYCTCLCFTVVSGEGPWWWVRLEAGSWWRVQASVQCYVVLCSGGHWLPHLHCVTVCHYLRHCWRAVHWVSMTSS